MQAYEFYAEPRDGGRVGVGYTIQLSAGIEIIELGR